MTCDELLEVLPAYALGVLEPEEQAAAEAHLAECGEHDSELVELRATSLALDLLREDEPAPESLRARVAAIPAGHGAPRRVGASRHWWLAAAAVVALLAVFAAGWGTHAVLDGGGGTSGVPASAVQYAYALQGANGEFVSFTGVEGASTVTVKMAGLSRLPSGQIYRLWAIRDGQWVKIGQCNTNAQGGWLGDFAFALNSGEALAVTVESTSADPQAPGAPILRTQG
ncbi:MAG: anti-sigma factor [Dehalococcoidia bacterium]